MNKTITWLTPEGDREWFPPLDQALDEPEGLLAVGGDLSPTRLMAAYRREARSFCWSSSSSIPRLVSPPRHRIAPSAERRSSSRGS